MDDDTGYASGWDNDAVRQTDLAPAQDYYAAKGDGERGFWSSHSGCFNAVLADGSVKSISYAIDPALFLLLGDKADGKGIGSDDL